MDSCTYTFTYSYPCLQQKNFFQKHAYSIWCFASFQFFFLLFYFIKNISRGQSRNQVVNQHSLLWRSRIPQFGSINGENNDKTVKYSGFLLVPLTLICLWLVLRTKACCCLPMMSSNFFKKINYKFKTIQSSLAYKDFSFIDVFSLPDIFTSIFDLSQLYSISGDFFIYSRTSGRWTLFSQDASRVLLIQLSVSWLTHPCPVSVKVQLWTTCTRSTWQMC